jgi:hypothetical protein
MPSGRDSFRRNRVAPFVLFLFYHVWRELSAARFQVLILSLRTGRFVYLFNLNARATVRGRGDPYRLVLQLALHPHVFRCESFFATNRAAVVCGPRTYTRLRMTIQRQQAKYKAEKNKTIAAEIQSLTWMRHGYRLRAIVPKWQLWVEGV